jgi:hypothetical protein
MRHLRLDGRFMITAAMDSNRSQASAASGGGNPDRLRHIHAARHDGNVKPKPHRNAGPNKVHRHDACSRENSSAGYALICMNAGRPDHYGSRTNIEHVAAQHEKYRSAAKRS